MNTVLRSGYVKARKQYHTDASCYFDFARYPREEGYRISEFKDMGMTDEEISTIIEADKRKWRIEVGEVHYSQTGVYDGDMYSYRAPMLIHKILIKYDLYQED